MNRENFKIDDLKSSLSCTVKLITLKKNKHGVIPVDISDHYPVLTDQLNWMYQKGLKLPRKGTVLQANSMVQFVIRDKSSDNSSINLIVEKV